MVRVKVVLDREDLLVVKGSVRARSTSCYVDGLGAVPPWFAFLLISGSREAWQLAEHIKGTPLSITGVWWILSAGDLRGAWERLKAAVENAPRGMPRFYKPSFASKHAAVDFVVLTNGERGYAITLDDWYHIDLPLNLYCENYEVVNAKVSYEELMALVGRPELASFLFDSLDRLRVVKELLNSRTYRSALHWRAVNRLIKTLTARGPGEAEKVVGEIIERAELLSALKKGSARVGDLLIYVKKSKLYALSKDGRVYAAYCRDFSDALASVMKAIKEGGLPKASCELVGDVHEGGGGGRS